LFSYKSAGKILLLKIIYTALMLLFIQIYTHIHQIDIVEGNIFNYMEIYSLKRAFSISTVFVWCVRSSLFDDMKSEDTYSTFYHLHVNSKKLSKVLYSDFVEFSQEIYEDFFLYITKKILSVMVLETNHNLRWTDNIRPTVT
jgi:hypothetical protein